MKPGDTLEFRRRDGGSLTSRLTPRDTRGVALTKLAQFWRTRWAWTSGALVRRSSDTSLGTRQDVPGGFGKANAGMLARLWNAVIDPS